MASPPKNAMRNKNIDQAVQAGLAHHQAGQLSKAAALYKKVLRAKPNHDDALHLLGMVAFQSGNHALAIELINRALRANPSSPIYYNNLGEIHRAQQRYSKAIDCYRQALLLKPDFAEACNNIASASKSQGFYDQAVTWYRKALAIKPEYAEASYNLGNTLQEQGKQKEALDAYHTALTLVPTYSKARWAYTMTQIPVMYHEHESPVTYKVEFARELEKLENWFSSDMGDLGYQCVGNQHPFYLAYQETNNRDLLSRCGALYARLMESWRKKKGFSLSVTAASGVTRIGIISAHIRNHSVWNALVKGWFQHLDRTRFELYVFHTGSGQDEETSWARSRSAFFVQGGKALHQWVESVIGKQPDVLIYPEVGMDPMTTKLASLRLAPVQVATWGHAETTGLPTIDYYLSAEDLEPPNAPDNYSEQLVLLPHLGCCYQPSRVEGVDPDFSALGVKPNSPVFICPGSPFKYTPEHDQVFTKIAQELAKCQFVFFTYRFCNLSDELYERLTSAFRRAGLDVEDHVIFVPWLEKPAFYGLLTHADVFLDTIGFSGFNTAIQAVECGIPIVSREGEFLRGRLASGILRRMGLPELVVGSEDDYVELAIKLAQDSRYRESVQKRIKARRHVLFGDLAPVRALESFLINAVKKH